jgi:hypothetical protein
MYLCVPFRTGTRGPAPITLARTSRSANERVFATKGRCPMKFMVAWKIAHDEWIAVAKTFSSMSGKDRVDAGEGVKIVGRWHDLVSRTGVAIFEANDLAAVQRYALRWNPYMDLTIAPVVEDEEAASVLRESVR